MLFVEALDELYSGVPAVGSADIQRSFATSYEALAGVLLVVPHVLGLVLEPALFVLADRRPRRWFVVGGLAMMSATAFASAAAPSAWVLAVAVAFAYVAAGFGVALAQATLADAEPDRVDQLMTRWTMLGVAGDLAAPGLFALLAALSLGWRTAYVVNGVLLGAVALLMLRWPFPHIVREPDEHEPGTIAAIRDALRTPGLIGWLLATFLCDLLDEILVVFAAIRLRDDLGAGVELRSAVLAAFVAGSAVGLVIAERLLRRVAPLRLLADSAASCTVAYATWLLAPSLLLAVAALVVTGATAAPLYPIIAARTYATLPGRSGTIHAAAHITTPLSLATPWLLGWLADRTGAIGALAVLAVAPIGIAVLATREHRRSKKVLAIVRTDRIPLTGRGDVNYGATRVGQ